MKHGRLHFVNTEIHQAPRPLREIRAVFTESTVRVYQAFGNEIAISALERQAFFPPFKLDGITSWIKPSFLWTMARTGWGRYTRIGAGRKEHEGDAKVLGIDIDRAFFDSLLESAQSTHFEESQNQDDKAWGVLIRRSHVLVQWDPEKDVSGHRRYFKAIQIGLRSTALRDYVHAIKAIEDQTPLIAEILSVDSHEERVSLLPPEMPYPVSESVRERLQMSTGCER